MKSFRIRLIILFFVLLFPLHANSKNEIYYSFNQNAFFYPKATEGFSNGRYQLFGNQSASSNLSINAARQSAVKRAWEQEKILIQKTGQGTKPWTAAERKEILNTGRVKGYEGHHIKDVSTNPKLARNPDNIKFVKGRQAHLAEHRGNFRNPSKGRSIQRNKLLRNYEWSVSKQSLFVGVGQIVSGGLLIWHYLPMTLRNYELYSRGSRINDRLFWETADSSLFLGSGVTSSIAGSARIAAFAIAKSQLPYMHSMLGFLRMTSNVAGPVAIALLVAENSVYIYRWDRGYISTPTFVKRSSISAGAAAGGTIGLVIGGKIGEGMYGEPGKRAGQAIGATGGAVTGAFLSSSIVNKYYERIDIEREKEFLDYVYKHYEN